MKTRIEQCVDDISAFIGGCKERMFGQGQIIVNKDEIDDLLIELQNSIPEDVKKYHNLVKNQQEIIKDAQAKANQKLEEAEAMKKQLVNENELMQEAYRQAHDLIKNTQLKAQEMLAEAQQAADAIKLEAFRYTDELLANLEKQISDAVDKSNKQYGSFVETMQDYYNTIVENRKELAPMAQEADVMEAIATVNEINNQSELDII